MHTTLLALSVFQTYFTYTVTATLSPCMYVSQICATQLQPVWALAFMY